MITKVEINNFRNFKNVSYQFDGQSVVFDGKNFTGKTNILNAISWVLTDKLIDGSSDIATIKPLNDTKAVVSVKLTFDDGQTIEKTYKEKWITTRGTNDQKLEGHETNYIINDANYKISEAERYIKDEIFKINNDIKTKVDLKQMYVNPLYLFENVNWKDMRNFIIEIVGDVSLDLVCKTPKIASNDYLKYVEDRLVIDKGYLDKTIKYFSDLSKLAKTNCEEMNIRLQQEMSKQDVDAEELKIAESESKRIEQLIHELKFNNYNVKNPLVAEKEEEILRLKNRLADLKSKNLQQIENDNIVIDEYNKTIRVEIAKLESEVDSIKTEISTSSSMKFQLERQKSSNEQQIEINSKEQDRLRARAYSLKNEKCFQIELPENIICKHCGGVVNDDVIESIKAKNEEYKVAHEKKVAETISLINKEGVELKNENERLTLLNKDLMVQMAKIDDVINSKKVEINDIFDKISTLKQQLKAKKEYTSNPEIDSLNAELLNANNELKELKEQSNNSNDVNAKINSLQEELKQYDEVISNHNYFLHTKRYIAECEMNLKELLNQKAKYECCLLLAQEIARTRIEMLQHNIKSVFGDIELQLVESNIKEGSWNEVCYPLVNDERTGNKVPFDNASRSQKYITAIKIVEKIRESLNHDVNVPLIIDEIGTFDSTTISKRLETKRQIIASRCNDIYNAPKLSFLNN